VLIVEINVQFHLFQEVTNQFTVVIVSVYCSDCFRQHKPDDSRDDRRSGNDRYSRDDRGSRYSRDDRGSRDNDREDTEVTCADCGNQCTVPFVPRSNKPVQEVTNQFTVVIVSDNTNQMIQEMIDVQEMIDIQEMIEAHDPHLDESLVEMTVDLENLEMINF